MDPREHWPLRAATGADRAGSVALLARSLPFDITDGPFRQVDCDALASTCWAPDGGTDGGSAAVRLVSEAVVGTLPGPDGVAVSVPAGIVVGAVAPPGAGADAGADAPIGHLQLLAVHPAHRGRGLGRALLAGVTAALREAGAGELTTRARPPRYGWPATDQRYTAFGLLLESAGWQRGDRWHNMTVDLDAASRDGLLDTAGSVSALAERGIEIRRAGEADAPALVEAAAGFSRSWADELTLALGRQAGHQGAVRLEMGGVHVAVRGGRIVGFACHGSSRPGWFGPAGVEPGERGAGIGGVLLRRCLVDIRAQGRGSAQINWVGPVGFYARLVGAYVDRTFVAHTLSEPGR